MSTDLTDALDRAIPRTDAAPALPPAELRLAHGRRGVRRRRLAAAGALAVVAVAAVAVPSALTGGGAADDRRSPQVADRAAPRSTPVSPTPEEGEAPPIDWNELPGDFVRSPTALVQLDAAADVPVLFDRGVTVVEVVEDPFARSGVFAWAGTVRYRGTTYWALAHRSGNGSYSTDTRPIPGRTIEQWVRDHEEVATSPLRPWVDLRPDGTLSPRDGVTIVEQQSPARVDQADPAAASATAMLEVDGARVCLIVRAGPSGSDEVPLPESEYKGCRDLPGWDYPGNPAS